MVLILTKRLRADLIPHGDQGWNVREFIVRRVIVDDLEKTFEPVRNGNGDIIITPVVKFQKTVSDPRVFKFIGADVSYQQYGWIPFMPKGARIRGNESIKERAEEIKAELNRIFRDGDEIRF